MNVVVGYASGAKMSYSLNAFHALGGLHHRLQRLQGPPGAQVRGDGLYQRRRHGAGELMPEGTTIRIFPHFRLGLLRCQSWTGVGGHGGGDDRHAGRPLSPQPARPTSTCARPTSAAAPTRSSPAWPPTSPWPRASRCISTTWCRASACPTIRPCPRPTIQSRCPPRPPVGSALATCAPCARMPPQKRVRHKSSRWGYARRSRKRQPGMDYAEWRRQD